MWNVKCRSNILFIKIICYTNTSYNMQCRMFSVAAIYSLLGLNYIPRRLTTGNVECEVLQQRRFLFVHLHYVSYTGRRHLHQEADCEDHALPAKEPPSQGEIPGDEEGDEGYEGNKEGYEGHEGCSRGGKSSACARSADVGEDACCVLGAHQVQG